MANEPTYLSRVHALVCAALGVLVGAGCTTTSYKQEVESFASSTNAAVTNVRMYIDEARRLEVRNELMTKLNAIQRSPYAEPKDPDPKSTDQEHADSETTSAEVTDSEKNDPETNEIHLLLNESCSNKVYTPHRAEFDLRTDTHNTCALKLCVVTTLSKERRTINCRSLPEGRLLEQAAAENEKLAMKQLNFLAAYASGLTRISSATDTTAIDTALRELSDAGVTLVGTTANGEAEKKELQGKVGPITALFSRVAGTYVAHRQWYTLKRVTKAVQPALETAANSLAHLALSQRNRYADAKMYQYRRWGSNIIQNDGSPETLERLAELHVRARSIQTLINSDPETMFDSMVVAHRALTADIAKPNGQAATVLTALRAFRNSVDNVRKAFEEEEEK